MPRVQLMIESLCKDSTCVNMVEICSRKSMPKITIQTCVRNLLASGPVNIHYPS